MENQPLTRTERKILVYKKCKEGMSYNQACNELKRELAHLTNMINKNNKNKQEDE